MGTTGIPDIDIALDNRDRQALLLAVKGFMIDQGSKSTLDTESLIPKANGRYETSTNRKYTVRVAGRNSEGFEAYFIKGPNIKEKQGSRGNSELEAAYDLLYCNNLKPNEVSFEFDFHSYKNAVYLQHYERYRRARQKEMEMYKRMFRKRV